MILYFDEQKPVDVLVMAHFKMCGGLLLTSAGTLLNGVIGIAKNETIDGRAAYTFMYDRNKCVTAREITDDVTELTYDIKIVKEVSGNA